MDPHGTVYPRQSEYQFFDLYLQGRIFPSAKEVVARGGRLLLQIFYFNEIPTLSSLHRALNLHM